MGSRFASIGSYSVASVSVAAKCDPSLLLVARHQQIDTAGSVPAYATAIPLVGRFDLGDHGAISWPASTL